jgi:replicative DNA helicase
MSVSTFGLGYKLLKRLCEEQQPLRWYKAKLIPDMFKPGEQEVLAWVTAHTAKHHALPKPETLFQQFNDVAQFPTPEPSSYYLEHVENRMYYEKINQSNIESQKILKENPGDHAKALQVLTECSSFIAAHRYRMRIVDLAKEGPAMALNAYHNVNLVDSAGAFGWPHMDNASGGLLAGDVVSIIGRPAAGKTWLVLRAALYNWQHMGRKPLVVSMEMSPLPLVQRLTAMYAHTNVSQLKSGGYSYLTYEKFANSLVTMSNQLSGFFVVDGNLAASVDDIYTLAVQLGCDQVYIDGAYLLKHPNKRLDRYTRVAENIELIKQRTSDIEMPTIASYQFARSATKGKSKTTKEGQDEAGLEDIAFSDGIGQISSIVLGLFQDESVETLEGRVVRVLKGRNGEIGNFKINWDFNNMNFDQDLPPKSDEPQKPAQLSYI